MRKLSLRGAEASGPRVSTLPALPYWVLLSSPEAVIAKLPYTRGLKTMDVYSLPVLETRSSKSRCWQDWLFLEALRETQVHASLWLLVVAWLGDTWLHSLPPSPHSLPLSVSLCVFSFSVLRMISSQDPCRNHICRDASQ